MKLLFQTIKIFCVLFILTGIIYPISLTIIAHFFFYKKATGSLIYNQNGELIGSPLIAQFFKKMGYFWPRPSVNNYNTMPAAGPDYGFFNKQRQDLLKERKEFIYDTHPEKKNYNIAIPEDLLKFSASGIDPHITPEAVFFQLQRVVKERNFNKTKQDLLIKEINNLIENPQFLIFGNRRINVLLLNLIVDKIASSSE